VPHIEKEGTAMRKIAWAMAAVMLMSSPTLAQKKPAGDKTEKRETVDITIKNFYGRFVGRGVTKSHGAKHFGLADRDLDVVIEAAAKGGFKLTWTTIRRRKGKAKRTSTQTIDFVPMSQPKRWKAKNSGDLLAGQPVIWARLAEARLYVYVIVTNPKTGRFQAAVYVRELIEDGMQLRFRRVRDGAPARAVVAYLKRVKK
jgi:hypothetical protein